MDQKGKTKREGLILARNAAQKLGAQWGLSPKRSRIWLPRTLSSARRNRDWVGTPVGVSTIAVAECRDLNKNTARESSCCSPAVHNSE